MQSMTVVRLDHPRVVRLADVRRAKMWREFELERMRRILMALELWPAPRDWADHILTADYSAWGQPPTGAEAERMIAGAVAEAIRKNAGPPEGVTICGTWKPSA
jgi:hypothetical protein